AEIDDVGRAELAGLDAAREIEGVQHHAFPSTSPTMRSVTMRANGSAKNAVTAATGQPTTKAESQRATKSARKPMLKKVTTALTMNTMMAVMTIGKMNLALPSIVPSPGEGRCDPKAPGGSRPNGALTMCAAAPGDRPIALKAR